MPKSTHDYGRIPGSASALVTSANLLAHFPLDAGQGTTIYNTATGGTASLNGPSWSTDSKTAGYSADFDGTDDNSNLGDLGTPSAYTVMVWAKADSPNNGNRQYVVVLEADKRLFIRLPGDGRTALIHYTSDSFVRFFTNISTDWNHYALSWDGSEVRGYKNASLVNSEAASTWASFGASDYFGSNGSPADFFDGHIDDFRFYNGALSDSEIQAIYDATK